MAKATTGQSQKRSGVISDLARREERSAMLLLVPTFVIILAVAIYPLAQVFISSFTDARFASSDPTSFVGFANYRQLLSMTIRELPPVIDPDTGEQELRDGEPRFTSWVQVLPREPLRYRSVTEFGFFGNRYVLGATNASFIASIGDTISFTVVAVFLETLFGMIIALSLAAKFFGRNIMRTAMLVPWAIITVVSARIWEWMFQSTRAGFFNSLFNRLGLSDGNTSFLTETSLQMTSIIAIDVWKTTPFMALLLLAGLTTIPGELYEAAEMDGATKVRQFFSITLPLLTPTLAVALVFRTLDSLRVFDLFQVVFGERRYSMASFAQDTLISNRDVGLSSAASVVIFIIIFVFAIIYIRALGVDNE